MSVLIVMVNEYDITSQQANIQNAITYASKFSRTRTRVDWFLSGAPRINSSISEAQLMSEAISTLSETRILVNKHNWHYIHDNRSTNIQNNFARLNEWLEFNCSYQEIQIVTTNYLDREIASAVIPGNKFKWIYSNLVESNNHENSNNTTKTLEPEKRQRVAGVV